MATQRRSLCRFLSFMFISGALQVTAMMAPPDPLAAQESAADGDVETLARGAVHEAFAEPIVFDPAPSAIISKEPPEPIEELPPETKPEGDNVVWLPGYWNWDEDRGNFIWISGFWRDIPPGRDWVAGYWTKAGDGWQRVAGYWASAAADEVEYLPEPPATLENGPATPAPSSDQLWMPGCWMWRETRYVWRPGYWTTARPDWIWIPAHFVATPAGFVFVSGYWDYPLEERGLLFAPVYFRNAIYTHPAYQYSPSALINLSRLTSHLWVRPSCASYYFGDYYASQYANQGFYPWHKFHTGRHGYDPIFAQDYYQHVHVEKDRDWVHALQRDYTRHVEQVDARPSHTFATLAGAAAVGTVAALSMKNLGLVTSLKQASDARDLPVKLQRVDETKRQQFAVMSKETKNLSLERAKLERGGGDSRPPSPRTSVPSKSNNDPKVVKGAAPAIEAPRVAPGKTGNGEKSGVGSSSPGNINVPGAKPPTGKPTADQTVQKFGRPRSSMTAKTGQVDLAKRSVPPGLDKPSDQAATSGKSETGKVGAAAIERPTKGIISTPQAKPVEKGNDTATNRPPANAPIILPTTPSTPAAKGISKVEPPATTKKPDTPKSSTKPEFPKSAPVVESPKPAPKNEPLNPKPNPKTEPSSKPKTESPKPAPKSEPPRSAPKPAPKAATPKSTPAPQPRPSPPPSAKGKSGKKPK